MTYMNTYFTNYHFNIFELVYFLVSHKTVVKINHELFFSLSFDSSTR